MPLLPPYVTSAVRPGACSGAAALWLSGSVVSQLSWNALKSSHTKSSPYLEEKKQP